MKIAGKNPLVKAQVKLHDVKKKLGGVEDKGKLKHGASAMADRVNLSGKAKKLARLRKLVEASPDVRAEKIEHIKNAIDEGKYNVKSSRVAEGIIKKAIDFYQSHRYLS